MSESQFQLVRVYLEKDVLEEGKKGEEGEVVDSLRGAVRRCRCSCRLLAGLARLQCCVNTKKVMPG